MQALENDSTGDYNTALGYDALNDCTTGRLNVAIGAAAMNGLSGGEQNVAIGYEAGDACTTGTGNVFLGMYAGRSQGNTSSSLYIARDSQGAGNAAVWIYGNNSGACYQGNNSSTWSTTSDVRLKKNISDSPKGLAEINQIRVTNFEYRKEDEIDMSEFPLADGPHQVCLNDETKEGVIQTGVIAQEVETILPECIRESDKGSKTVNTDPVMWALVNAVKELSARVEELESKSD